jgi:hypothetical protein
MQDNREGEEKKGPAWRNSCTGENLKWSDRYWVGCSDISGIRGGV